MNQKKISELMELNEPTELIESSEPTELKKLKKLVNKQN